MQPVAGPSARPRSRVTSATPRCAAPRGRLAHAVKSVLADAPAKHEHPHVANVVTLQTASVEDGLYTVHGRLMTAAPAGLVYDILTDYENGSSIFSSIDACQVLETPAGKELLQDCGWSFLAFSGTFQTRLQVQEDPAAGTLVFRISESDFMQEFEGRWQVCRTADDLCQVDHTLSVRLSIPMPGIVTKYTKTIFAAQVTTVLEELSTEVLRRLGSGCPSDQ